MHTTALGLIGPLVSYERIHRTTDTAICTRAFCFFRPTSLHKLQGQGAKLGRFAFRRVDKSRVQVPNGKSAPSDASLPSSYGRLARMLHKCSIVLQSVDEGRY